MRSGAPRVVACAVVAIAAPATVLAAPSAKVTIESEPPAAKVYVDAIEDGVKCEPTPCTFDTPLGQSSVIVVLEGYDPDIFPLDLRKRGKFTFKRTLHRAMGSLKVDGARGVGIEVKNADDGTVKATATVPHTFDLPTGEYTVVFTQNGKPFDTEAADIEKDQEVQLTAKPPQTAAKQDPKPDEKDPGEDDLGDGGKIEVKKQAPSKPPRERIVAAGALFDFGARKFDFTGGTNTAIGWPFAATHMAGVAVELWPLATSGSRALRRLSIYARAELSVIATQITMTSDGMPLAGLWRSFEGSVRYRFVVGQSFAIEPSVGYVRDQLLADTQSVDQQKLPIIDYQAMRVGVKLAYLAGRIEPYVALEDRIVLSGGSYTQRFDISASADGVRGALGAEARFGRFLVRLEGSATQYSWTFKSTDATLPTAGTDLLTQLMIVAGFQY